MKKLGLAVFAGLLLSAGVVVFAAPKTDAEVVREMRDRLEIEDLMWRYARALDTNDPDAYAAIYTPDGQFGTGPNATRGRDALRKMVADLKQRNDEAAAKGDPRPPMYHMTANDRITFTGKDSAKIEAYWITTAAAGGQKVPMRVISVGHSVDELVRVNGQWLIKARNVAPAP